MKFHENPISGSRDGRTDGQKDRQTSMTKIIVVFRCFASVPKHGFVICRSICGSIPTSIFFCGSRLKYLIEYFDTAQNAVSHKPMSSPSVLSPPPSLK